MAAVGLGLGLGATLAAVGPLGAQAVEVTVESPHFEMFQRLAFEKGDRAPCGESVDLLKEYANSDFGRPIVDRIIEDAQVAVSHGYLTDDGVLTDEGVFEGYQPFRISCSSTAEGGFSGIGLPSTFPKTFRYSGEEIHPLAVVHHEMGHTKYGTPAQVSDIVTDEHGSRYHVQHELEIVKKYENPVRESHGYSPRTSYTNHLGETAKLSESAEN